MNTLYRLARRSPFAPAGLLMMAVLPFLSPPATAEPLFNRTNLVTDDQTANPAQITDPNLVNAWGISFSPTTSTPGSPFWVSDNGTGLTTLYRVDPNTNATSIVPLVVTIPPAGAGNPTGQVFNSNNSGSNAAFNGDRFLFVSEDGTISGWKGGSTADTQFLGSSSNVYKGVALNGSDNFLYAANFRNNTIDVFDKNFNPVKLAGSFTDPNPPAGFAPFNIQNLNGTLYVTYALQDSTKHDDVAAPGNGFVDAFDLQGNFLRRVASQGTLNSPWGLAIAPASFGELAGDLLVGNFGDGHINAFKLPTDAFDGQLPGIDGKPLSIDGLWALTPGNNGNAGSSNKLYFSAGPNGEMNGLFGVIEAPEPGTLSLLGACAIPILIFRRRYRA